ncbi:MAG TPA: hypothetical protein VHU85_03000 [Acidimicrobiales bacterium]|nr:hypothetical protein [Acidimicrobiales bacterium]
MAGSLKRQRLLIALGFIVVAVAFGSQIAVVDYQSGIRYWDYEGFFGAAYTVGYGFLAWATWAWFTWLERNPISGTSLATVLKLFAIANLAFAVGLVSVTYYWAHQAISLPYDGRLSIAIPITDGLQLFGFCLVSAGLWSAAWSLRADARLASGHGESILEPADLEAPV